MENKKQIFLNSNVDWFEAQLIMEICWGNSGLASKLSLGSLTDSRCLRFSLPTHLHLNFFAWVGPQLPQASVSPR